MKILSFPFINSNYNKQKEGPSFQKLDKFVSLKQIEGLTCACCGEKVLSANKYAQMITPLSKSLHISMQKGNLNFVRSLFPESWKILRDFTYKYPNKSLDEIVESSTEYTILKRSVANKLDNPDLEPQSPQRLELDRSITKAFFNILASGRSNMKESPIVMNTVMPFKSIINGRSKELFELFENYSKIYPNKTLSEIVQEVYKDHEIKGNQFKENNLNLIYEKFDAIKRAAKDSGMEISEDLNKAQDEIIAIYEKDIDGIQYRQQEIKKIYNRILKKNKCAFLFPKIIKQISELPPSLENIDTYITQAHDYKFTDAKILFSMFRSNFSSEEKIVSLDDNGANKIGNKIVMCNHCVKLRRNSSDFDSFVHLHPEMIKNAQKQMNIIMNEIFAKNLEGNFRFYPLIIEFKFRELTKGKMRLDLYNYSTKIIEDSKIEVQNLKDELQRYKNERNEKIALMSKYPKLESDFIREINRINSKIEKIQEKINTERSLQNHANNYLKNYDKNTIG